MGEQATEHQASQTHRTNDCGVSTRGLAPIASVTPHAETDIAHVCAGDAFGLCQTERELQGVSK